MKIFRLFTNHHPSAKILQQIHPTLTYFDKRLYSVFRANLPNSLVSHTQATQKSKEYSSLSQSSSLTICLEKGMKQYLFLQQATNEQKIVKTFQSGLQQALFLLTNEKIDPTKVDKEVAWNLLKEILESQKIFLSSFNAQNYNTNIKELFGLFPRKLMKDNKLLDDFQPKDYLFTPTEKYWSFYPLTFPFTSNQTEEFPYSRISYIIDQFNSSEIPALNSTNLSIEEKTIRDIIYYNSSEDALGALLLATSYLSQIEGAIIHEMGCWNGENLFNTLYYSYLNKKNVVACLGTDINRPVLNVAEATAEIMGLNTSLVQFHLANSLHPTIPSILNTHSKKEIKIALRLLPVLSPDDGKKFLLSVKHAFKATKNNSILILSFAVPEGERYRNNKLKAEVSSDLKISDSEKISEEPFDGGVVFKAHFPHSSYQTEKPDVVLNTYYTQEAFCALAQKCGFVVERLISVGKHSDNSRVIAALRLA